MLSSPFNSPPPQLSFTELCLTQLGLIHRLSFTKGLEYEQYTGKIFSQFPVLCSGRWTAGCLEHHSDYFGLLLPGFPGLPSVSNAESLTLVYQPFVLGTISVLVFVGQKIKNQRRVFTGYCLFVDIVTKGKGGITPFLLLSIVSAGFSVASALVEGAMIGDLSCICPDLIQPFAAGLGVAGAITSVLRLLTKEVFQNSRDGLRKGALSFLAISLFIELVCVIIYGVMFPKLPMVQKHRARSGSNPVEPVEEVPPLSNQQLAHQNLDRVISLFLIYALTLSIFPGFLYENTGKHSLHLWYPLVLVTCFNLSDALSRYITMVKPLKMQSGKVIVASVLARMLFLPAFYITARYADQGWMITLTSFLGISNGYLTVCVLTQTPKRTYNVSEANALGNILVASMLGGSLLVSAFHGFG
ncbi:hypothetical protein IGI04_026030 [Brassica rapa subsp. trilocularis]|uniref:Uncharacterized protein n=1 Tax=Brassica rapa subsp. trilocularis TaxID=1813537 RepID=A0ABQ7KUR9_BRACM|nr:hypothetical protein IGI04_026030 [Brassica rapa subsp. trilocularis]